MVKFKRLCESGDGIYAKPVRDRIIEKLNKFAEEHNVVNFSLEVIPPKNGYGTEIHAYVMYDDERGA